MNDPRDVEAGEIAASPDIVVRASERIPSPVVGPDASTCPVRVVREETAARTEVLNGTALDARLVRLPRAGELVKFTYVHPHVMN